MSGNKRRKQIYAGILAATLSFSMVIPANVRGGETKESETSKTAEETLLAKTDIAGAEVSRGEYVIYTEDDTDVDAGCLGAEQEIVRTEQDAVYEADLSEEQILKLEEAEEVLVEENFFFSGLEAEDKEKKRIKQEIKKQLLEKNKEDETEWNYQMIHADEASDAQTDGRGTVKVAVLDSGVELLSGIPVADSVNLVKEEQYLPYYMDDMVGHGTAAADIIHQICPEAEIYSVRVLDKENKGRLSDVVEGIYWCIEQKMDIINMSFGTPVESEILKKAIWDASDAGILITGAAGNGGSTADVEYPAAFEEVIAVGAVDTSAQKTEESVTGPEVELVAPGEQILTKSVFGMETVNSGTSMAAPHVAGAAALLMQQDEEKSAEEIRKILDVSGNPIGEQEAYGYGLLDVAYAKQLLEDGGDALEGILVQADTEEELPVREKEDVETFEEVDYVEGRWSGTSHKQLIENGARLCGDFTETQIKLLKAGAVYPDEALGGVIAYPEWHGMKGKNYMANYIFATKIAKNGGNTTNLAKVMGQGSLCYDRMKAAISTSGIIWSPNVRFDTKNSIVRESWGIIINRETGLNYSVQTTELKEKWRRYFLYGMAAHIITDTFSHSSYDANFIEITHNNGAHDTNNNRYECAKYSAYLVAVNSQLKVLGDVLDFSSKGQGCWKGFYIMNILQYAIESDIDNLGVNILTKEFENVDFSSNKPR